MSWSLALRGTWIPDLGSVTRRLAGAVAPRGAEGHVARIATGLALAVTLAFLPFETLPFTAVAGPQA